MTLTYARLRELLSYDPETGLFTWRSGAIAGGRPNKAGYLRIGIDGESYYAHRLAFLYMLGRWPTIGVDHENGLPADNRWKNLREADQSFNSENQRRPRSHNTSGKLGVEKNGSGFAARIRVRGKRFYLGTFPTTEQAHTAYVKAKRQLHEGCTI